MSNPIEVYKISRETVMCESLGSITVRSVNLPVYVCRDIDQEPVCAYIETKNWRIRRIVNCKQILNSQCYDRFEKFIAVDPDLEDMLIREVKQHLGDEINKLLHKCSVAEADKQKLKQKITKFDNLVWWKRVWYSLFYGVGEYEN